MDYFPSFTLMVMLYHYLMLFKFKFFREFIISMFKAFLVVFISDTTGIHVALAIYIHVYYSILWLPIT